MSLVLPESNDAESKSIWANVTVLIFSFKKDCACLGLTKEHVQTNKNAFSAGCDIKKESLLV